MNKTKNVLKKTTLVARAKSIRSKVMTICTAMMLALSSATMASAADFGQAVTIDTSSAPNAAGLMGKIIGILLTITRFVGVALVIYGVYEIVMSFMQNQPEAKTKGIIMALAGVVMIALKSVLSGLGIIS